MKKLTKDQFNKCKTRRWYNWYNAKKIKLVALVGTQETSAKEIYEIILEDKNYFVLTKTFFVQRFIADKKNENIIISLCKYV